MTTHRVPTGDELRGAFDDPGIMWHQRWEIAPGVHTPGRNDVAFLLDAAGVPERLDGRRVLDIGAFNGCISFELERRGAAEVVALDIMTADATGFSSLAPLLDSHVRWVRGSVYELAPAVHGEFDVIIFFGVLYHLRYPILAFDRLRSVASGELYVESHVIDQHWHDPRRWMRRLRRLEMRHTDTPIWRQYRPFELNPVDPSNTFGPNTAAVRESLENSGFEVLGSTNWDDRAAYSARITPRPVPAELSYEAAYPATAELGGLPLRTDDQFQ
ncbi:MAG: class I SAM-dependent methyltransferase [Actinomycetota bacterium]